MRRFFFLVALLCPVACDSQSSPSRGAGGTGNTNTAPAAGGGTDGSRAGGSSGTPAVGECGLPVPSTTDVPKPTGTPGNLMVVNWAGFEGAVTYTFDDANSSQIAHYPELQALGVRMTFYLQTGKSDAGNAIWAQAIEDGNELGNHTKSHARPGNAEDIDAATTFIQSKFGVTPWTMAAPFGDSSYVALAQGKFIINRGVSNAVITPNQNIDPYSLPCFIPVENAPASAFNEQIDKAKNAGGWRVVLVHGFVGGSDGAYQAVDIAEFASSVNYAKSLSTMWIDSMVNVGSYWLGQKLVSGVQAATSGSDQTYSWTLPTPFPPGKCLRVTVDGGTVKQGEKTLEWDSHGYYEISLDAGSVTISP